MNIFLKDQSNLIVILIGDIKYTTTGVKFYCKIENTGETLGYLKSPLLDGARKLKSLGFSGATKLTTKWENKKYYNFEPVALDTASKKLVIEKPTLRFVKYIEHYFAKGEVN